MRSAIPGRSVLSPVCALLAVVVLAAGGILVYLRIEVLSEDRFADRAVEAVQDPQVRAVIADRVVTAAIDVQPDLLSARPVLVSAVRGAIATPAFEVLVRAAARQAFRVLFDREQPTIAVDVADAAGLVFPAVRSVDPELAEELPRRIEAPLALLRERTFATDTLEAADRVRALAVVLPLLGIALLVAAVWLADDRARGLRRVPLAVAGAAGIVLIVLLLAEPDATRRVQGLTLGQANSAIDDVWDAFVGGLRVWAIVIGLTAVAATLLLSPRAARLARPARALVRAAVASPRGRRVRASRGVLLLLAGVLVVTAPSNVVQIAGVALGGLLLAAGAADLLASSTPGAEPLPRRVSRPLLAAVAGIALVVVAGVGLALALNARDEAAPAQRVADAGGTCNGSAELCERRVNEVVFPGTHNSMSAADEPGWLFANQRRSIPRQLDDGIRLFLIDAHWGVRASNGRIRTDLQAEGSTRNRVAAALGPEAVRTAERLVGRVGIGDLRGRREVWLCHTLCELGATRMSTALGQLRGWLDDHPGDLVVLFIEPSVPPWAIERELRTADLLDRVATPARDRPLPTLGELLEDGKQVVVFGERDTGDLPWYLDGFDWVQDTPLGNQSGTSCAEARGEPDSPILMINHWTDDFPPRPSANRRIGTRAAILARAERCERRRGLLPTFIAVDHYELGEVVSAAAELNRRAQTIVR